MDLEKQLPPSPACTGQRQAHVQHNVRRPDRAVPDRIAPTPKNFGRRGETDVDRGADGKEPRRQLPAADFDAATGGSVRRRQDVRRGDAAV